MSTSCGCGEGALIRVDIPVHVIDAENSPGVKRGGAVNIVTHTIEVRCSPEASRRRSRSTSAGLEINYSKHLSDVELPTGVKT